MKACTVITLIIFFGINPDGVYSLLFPSAIHGEDCTQVLQSCNHHSACQKLWRHFRISCKVEHHECLMTNRTACYEAHEYISKTPLHNCKCDTLHAAHGFRCHRVQLHIQHNRCVDDIYHRAHNINPLYIYGTHITPTQQSSGEWDVEDVGDVGTGSKLIDNDRQSQTQNVHYSTTGFPSSTKIIRHKSTKTADSKSEQPNSYEDSGQRRVTSTQNQVTKPPPRPRYQRPPTPRTHHVRTRIGAKIAQVLPRDPAESTLDNELDLEDTFDFDTNIESDIEREPQPQDNLDVQSHTLPYDQLQQTVIRQSIVYPTSATIPGKKDKLIDPVTPSNDFPNPEKSSFQGHPHFSGRISTVEKTPSPHRSHEIESDNESPLRVKTDPTTHQTGVSTSSNGADNVNVVNKHDSFEDQVSPAVELPPVHAGVGSKGNGKYDPIDSSELPRRRYFPPIQLTTRSSIKSESNTDSLLLATERISPMENFHRTTMATTRQQELTTEKPNRKIYAVKPRTGFNRVTTEQPRTTDSKATRSTPDPDNQPIITKTKVQQSSQRTDSAYPKLGKPNSSSPWPTEGQSSDIIATTSVSYQPTKIKPSAHYSITSEKSQFTITNRILPSRTSTILTASTQDLHESATTGLIQGHASIAYSSTNDLNSGSTGMRSSTPHNEITPEYYDVDTIADVESINSFSPAQDAHSTINDVTTSSTKSATVDYDAQLTSVGVTHRDFERSLSATTLPTILRNRQNRPKFKGGRRRRTTTPSSVDDYYDVDEGTEDYIDYQYSYKATQGNSGPGHTEEKGPDVTNSLIGAVRKKLGVDQRGRRPGGRRNQGGRRYGNKMAENQEENVLSPARSSLGVDQSGTLQIDGAHVVNDDYESDNSTFYNEDYDEKSGEAKYANTTCLYQLNSNPPSIVPIPYGHVARINDDNENASCASWCKCVDKKKDLLCEVIGCINEESEFTKECNYAGITKKFGFLTFLADRGMCTCYGGVFVCERPENSEFMQKQGAYLVLGYSEREAGWLQRKVRHTDAAGEVDFEKGLFGKTVARRLSNAVKAQDEKCRLKMVQESKTGNMVLKLQFYGFPPTQAPAVSAEDSSAEEDEDPKPTQPVKPMWLTGGPEWACMDHLENLERSLKHGVLQRDLLFSSIKQINIINTLDPSLAISLSPINIYYLLIISFLSSLYALLILDRR